MTSGLAPSASLWSFRALGAEILQSLWHWRIEIYNQKMFSSSAYSSRSGPLRGPRPLSARSKLPMDKLARLAPSFQNTTPRSESTLNLNSVSAPRHVVPSVAQGQL
ncbi:hypothetical protein TNCV_3557661 [Trichonephila clavipes]|uniref:Uncharacterized protein n=1 Tax=Trichonephila clavipes TaxID=2585209 RepID=A0A8X6WC21_TRICX|nr:hypothetical protein TNCV_3557661 [Trichonephila clavipes]